MKEYILKLKKPVDGVPPDTFSAGVELNITHFDQKPVDVKYAMSNENILFIDVKTEKPLNKKARDALKLYEIFEKK